VRVFIQLSSDDAGDGGGSDDDNHDDRIMKLMHKLDLNQIKTNVNSGELEDSIICVVYAEFTQQWRWPCVKTRLRT